VKEHSCGSDKYIHVVLFGMCSVVVFIVLYIYMTELWICPRQLLFSSSFFTAVGYLCNIGITGFFSDIPSKIWTCE